ncbi:two-component regulator propeller domain-containing protein [Winogradskyella sp. R77965]|uniref:ligand-binding sensor domain-containing protein n=1 Tax=Winogradskyella sp. R77965 TaxID=3093872 RepID=UPI0037DCBAEB
MKLQTYFFLILFGLQIGYSQTHIYEHFGVDEGLPSSEVYDIYQDKRGYIWFATDKGLSRYNGYEFENFTTKDGLPDNTILDFYPQENGQVWCYGYHSQSLFYFNDDFDGFKAYKFNVILKNQLDPKSILKSVAFDKNGTLYAGGYNVCGLIEINKEGTYNRQFEIDSRPTSPTEIYDINLGIQMANNVFFSVCHNYESEGDTVIFDPKTQIDSRVDIVFLNDEHSIFIDENLGVLSKNGDIKYYETRQNPTGIKLINDDSFFVGYYNNGAEIRDVSGKVIETFLPKKSVSSFLIDKEGSYWFSTIDDGVFYIKNPNIKVLTEDHISSLVKDHKNTLYAGFYNGNIVSISTTKIATLHKGLKGNTALVEFDSKRKHLYGYCDEKLVNYTDNDKAVHILASNLPEHIGDTLLSSSSNHLYKLKNNKVIRYELNKKIQDVCGYNDTVLIGTSTGLFIQENEKIKPNQSLDILKSRIDDIDLNINTNLVYMATQGAGVIVYGDSIYNITKANGLTNNIVSEVYIENDSTVWACTHTGLNRIRFKPNNSTDVATITKADGLLSNDIDDIEIINDTIWVATKKGLCYFKKALLEDKKTSNILSLALEDVTANDKNIYSKNVKLNYDENNIELKLQAISHKNKDHINYYYRLKEIDTSWTKTTNRTISFPSLSPGNYTFEAKANVLNNQNDLSVLYAFKIRPPFWKSWWFYSICVLILFGLVYLFFKVRVLSYNQDVFRELIRLAIKRLKRKEQFYKFRSNGEDFKIPTHDILYVNSQGNYLDITTNKKTYTIRCKIGDFINTTPDALEYLRVHRSYIIRIDQVSSKGKNWVVIKDQRIPVGETYLSELEKIHF